MTEEGMTAGDQRRPLSETATRGWEKIAWIGVVLLTLATRLYDLGHRVMSHDESLHTYYSWKLFDHMEYVHDPMMHGPLLYHGTALMYFLFGDNDFSARMFTVVLGLGLVLSPLLLRKWLGPVGALATGIMLLISPTVMYYSRYIRHDIHVELFTVLMFVGFIRYLDRRQGRWIVLAFAAGSLAISSAEMAYINGFVLVCFIVLALIVEQLSSIGAKRLGALLFSTGLGLLVFASLAELGGFDALGNQLLNTPLSAIGDFLLTGLPDFSESPIKYVVEAGFLGSGLMMIFGVVSHVLAGLRASDPLANEALMLAEAHAKASTGRLDEAAEADEALDEADDEADDETDRSPETDLRDDKKQAPMGMGDIVFGEIGHWLLVAGALILSLGWYRYGAVGCGDDAQTAVIGQILGADACRVYSGIMAAGAVVLLYGIVGMLLRSYRERPLAAAIGGASLESLALGSAVAIAIYTLLYTTFFTNPEGINGLVRSIRYWVDQHDVVRGDQPWYYYGLFTPMYEFLPFFFALAGAWVYTRHAELRTWRGDESRDGEPPSLAAAYFVPGLITWSAGVFWIYSWAGEKMPWLIVHFVVPFSFLAGRAIGDVYDRLDLGAPKDQVWRVAGSALLVVLAAFLFVIQLLYAPTGWAIITGLLSVFAIVWLLRSFIVKYRAEGDPRGLAYGAAFVIVLLLLLEWQLGLVSGMARSIVGMVPAVAGGGAGLARAVAALLVLGGAVWLLRAQGDGLAGRTVRGIGILVLAVFLLVANTVYSLEANFENEELATEYIVYAHATDDANVVLDRLHALQTELRANEGRDLVVGYDNEVSWPFTWYFRTNADGETDFPAARYLGDKPGGAASLRDLDVVLVGSPNYGAFEDYLVREFNSIEYDRMWWPNEGYKGYGIQPSNIRRLLDNLADPNYRRSLMNILLKREYVEDPRVAPELTTPKSLDSWYHHAKMKMWVKKEIDDQPAAAQGGDAVDPNAPTPTPGDLERAEPLELDVELRADQGPDGAPLQQPKGIEVGPDGRIYVVDHGGSRIVVFDEDGQAVESIAGEFVADGNPSAWGVGVAPDGAVYVADTWNHRVVKYVDGEQVLSWGVFGAPSEAGQELNLFYGPRDVAVDADGRVYVADTGNKRISIFDAEGTPISFIGGAGLEVGQLSEPTSVSIDPATGDIYVADLWNYRVQVFDKDLRPIRQWNVDGWQSQDAQHKAYIDVHPDGYVIFSDPEKSRVWLYTTRGKVLGLLSLPSDDYGMALPIGVAFDAAGRILVASSENGLVTRYAAPAVMQAGAESDAEASDEDASADEGEASGADAADDASVEDGDASAGEEADADAADAAGAESPTDGGESAATEEDAEPDAPGATEAPGDEGG